jgi:Family of unknown function (DUF6644)
MDISHVQSMLRPWCVWIQNRSWAGHIRTSYWVYPFIQLIHFTGLSIWLGTIVVADVSLLGFGNKNQTAAQVRDELFWWNWIGFCVVVTGGFLLFSPLATQYILNPAFRIKLGMLVPMALVWHIFVQWRTPRWGQTAETPLVAKLAGLIELALWIGVVTAAVNIPLYGA